MILSVSDKPSEPKTPSMSNASKAPDGFIELYEEVWRSLYRYAFYYIGNIEDAEDILQETALRAYKGFHTLKNKKAFKSWIFKIHVILL